MVTGARRKKDDYLSEIKRSRSLNTGRQQSSVHRQDHTSGGRRGGVSRSDDGRLDVSFRPRSSRNRYQPEQLFAAGWSACFISAMGVVANKMKVRLPADAAIDAEIDLCQFWRRLFSPGAS